MVALLGRNRPNWVWGELAAHCLGCMSIGVYADVLADEAGYLLGYSGARAVLAEDEEQVDKLLELGDRAPELRWIVYHDDRGMAKYTDPRLVSWRQLHERAAKLAAERPGLFESEVALGRGQDVGILCTTSGTTSHPKLAMLQFRPFLEHMAAYLRADPRGSTDEYVCMLPLPWIMEQVYVLGMPLLCRNRVSFPESAETAIADLREIGPTHLLLAPRVWEQMAADVRARMMDANAPSRWLFERGFAVARRAIERGGRSALADLLLMQALKDRLGFSRVQLGGHGRRGTRARHLQVLPGHGHAAAPALRPDRAVRRLHAAGSSASIDCDSSGLPFDDTEIRIDDPDESGVGEIVTRHAGMFKGYFRARPPVPRR